MPASDQIVAGLLLTGVFLCWCYKTFRPKTAVEGGESRTNLDQKMEKLLDVKAELLKKLQTYKDELIKLLDTGHLGSYGDRRWKFLNDETERIAQQIENIDCYIRDVEEARIREAASQSIAQNAQILDMLKGKGS